MEVINSPAVKEYDGQVAEAGHRCDEKEEQPQADMSHCGGRGESQPVARDKWLEIDRRIHALAGKGEGNKQCDEM